jgi:hypothetical protein
MRGGIETKDIAKKKEKGDHTFGPGPSLQLLHLSRMNVLLLPIANLFALENKKEETWKDNMKE